LVVVGVAQYQDQMMVVLAVVSGGRIILLSYQVRDIRFSLERVDKQVIAK
jgi:hypothetical protein